MSSENYIIDHPSHCADSSVMIRFELADMTERLPHALASAVEYILRKKEGCPEEVDLMKARWWLIRALSLAPIKLDPLETQLLHRFVATSGNSILVPLIEDPYGVITDDCIKETIKRINYRLYCELEDE